MCSRTRNAQSAFLFALVLTVFLLGALTASGQSFVQLSAGPVYPAGGFLAGQTGVTLNYQIVNTSDGPIVLDTIKYGPSCATADPTCPTPQGMFDLSTFTSGTGTGACAGTTFSVSNTNGLLTLTPSGTVTLASGGICGITFSGITVASCPAGGSTFGVGSATAHGAINTGTSGSGSGSSTATCLTCAVKIDKQVQCNAGPWTDVTGSDDATGTTIAGCSAIIGQTVGSRYIVSNTGTANASCGLTDMNGGGSLFTSAAGTVTIAAGQTNPAITGFSTQCSTTFSGQEPNTATLNCTCSVPSGGSVMASASDTARITCSVPQFSVTKDCVAEASAGAFHSTVHINNTGTDSLSCNVTDQTFAGACPPTGTGTPVLGFSNPVVAPTGTTTNTSSSSFTLATTSCNQASVTCLDNGQSFAGNTQTATAVCPIGTGCFTRTPGYWGTHPLVTQQVIDGGLPVCGITLTTTTAHLQGSATEDLCVNANDAKACGTRPQETTLIRACTAAALNLRVSTNPSANLSCEGALPGITALFTSCCVGTTSTCGSGGTAGGNPSVDSCSTALDAFNNQFDNTSFPSFLNNTNVANPTQCKAANGNGFLNIRPSAGINSCH